MPDRCRLRTGSPRATRKHQDREKERGPVSSSPRQSLFSRAVLQTGRVHVGHSDGYRANCVSEGNSCRSEEPWFQTDFPDRRLERLFDSVGRWPCVYPTLGLSAQLTYIIEHVSGGGVTALGRQFFEPCDSYEGRRIRSSTKQIRSKCATRTRHGSPLYSR